MINCSKFNLTSQWIFLQHQSGDAWLVIFCSEERVLAIPLAGKVGMRHPQLLAIISMFCSALVAMPLARAQNISHAINNTKKDVIVYLTAPLSKNKSKDDHKISQKVKQTPKVVSDAQNTVKSNPTKEQVILLTAPVSTKKAVVNKKIAAVEKASRETSVEHEALTQFAKPYRTGSLVAMKVAHNEAASPLMIAHRSGQLLLAKTETPKKPHLVFAQSNNTNNATQTQQLVTRPTASTANSANGNNAQQAPAQQFVSARSAIDNAQDIDRGVSIPGPAPSNYLNSKLGLGPQSRLRVSGFISAGSLVTNSGANYRLAQRGLINNRVNFEAPSIIGLQVNARITKRFEVVTQFVASGDDNNNMQPFRVNAEWAYLRFSFNSNNQMRTGRFRLPAFLYSEVEQIGYSYPWQYLPNEVYQLIPVDNLNGGSYIFNFPLGNSAWVFELQPFYGSNKSEIVVGPTLNPVVVQGTVVDFTENNVYGSAFTFTNSIFTLRGAFVHLQTTATANLPVGPNGRFVRTTLVNRAPSKFYSLGVKMDFHHVLLISEWAKRLTPVQFPSLEGFYISLGYHFGKFLPILTYGEAKTVNDAALIASRGELPQDQRSYTAGLAYYFNNNVVSKVSVSRITPLHGTFGFFNANPGRRNIYMYGFSVDAIF